MRSAHRGTAVPVAVFALLVSLASPGAGSAQRPFGNRPHVTALTHATLIDGTGAGPQAGRTILVRGRQILSVFPDGARPIPDSATVEDLTGKWVIPGIMDAHVHMTGAAPDAAGYEKLMRWLVEGGVVALRDMAGDSRVLSSLARSAMLDEIVSPDIAYSALMAGPTFFAEDARVASTSEGVLVGAAPWMRAVDETTDIPLAVAEAKGAGATALKLYANLPADAVAGLTAEAHRQGLLVWAHATVFPTGPSEEAADGVDVLSHTAYLVWAAAPRVPQDYTVRAKGDFEHTRPDDPRILAVLDSMKARGEILDATLRVFEEEEARTPDAAGKGIAEWGAAVTRIAHERGVLVDAGTDNMGSPEDTVPNVHREMASLVDHAGFTPVEAIGAATRVAAMTMGLEATHGTVSAGKMADLVVLSADPTKDIRNTRAIVEVWKHGKRVVPGGK
jgi:imidazolonepropionase-like amidohydrolase